MAMVNRVLTAIMTYGVILAMTACGYAAETATGSAKTSTIGLDNGTLHIKLDLATGGAICYLSTSGSTRNLVNIADRGRYIQQSYYAGRAIDRKAEGQSPHWSPWSWNPIGAGDTYLNPAKILDSKETSDTLYAKTLPLLWDMKNEAAQCNLETWVSLHGNSAHVRNRLTCFRTDNRWPAVSCDQELPAVYTIGELPNLFTYQGDKPWSRGALTQVKNAGPPWAGWKTLEHWAAQVDDKGWGVGVYNARSVDFIGGFCGPHKGGATDGSCGYIAPLRKEVLDKNTVYEYEYDLIVGTTEEIRDWVYRAEKK